LEIRELEDLLEKERERQVSLPPPLVSSSP
jgi:hypothetical protein